MLALGPENFDEIACHGFHEMDRHFKTAPFERNFACAAGDAGLVYTDFFGAQTVAVCLRTVFEALPGLPAAVDQESNGKDVTLPEKSQLQHRRNYLG